MPEGGRECAHGAAEKLGHPGQPVPAPHPLLRGSSHLNTSTDTHRYRDSHTHGDGGYMVSENVQWPMGTAVLPADHTVALGTGEPLAHSSPAARSHLGWQPQRGGGWQSCFGGAEGLALIFKAHFSLQLHQSQSPALDTGPITAGRGIPTPWAWTPPCLFL